MSELAEPEVLADAMRLYFMNRDQAVFHQNIFREEQQIFIRELTAAAHPKDDIRLATMNFEKSSKTYALFRQSMAQAEHALKEARAWYDGQAYLSGEYIADEAVPLERPECSISAMSSGGPAIRWNELATETEDGSDSDSLVGVTARASPA